MEAIVEESSSVPKTTLKCTLEPGLPKTSQFRDPSLCPSLYQSKARRPRRSHASTAWNSETDVWDNAFNSGNLPTVSVSSLRAQGEYHAATTAWDEPRTLASRRSTLVQPAQRFALNTERGGVTNPKRRRSHVNDEYQPQATPSHLHGENGSIYKSPQIKKEPRRRTIYIPSDDTTIFTIHPGRSLKNADSRPKKARRSDVFFDIAETPEQDLPQNPKHPRAPRPSLVGAPRRMPLKNVLQPAQPSTRFAEISGSGDGKENIAPGSTKVASCLLEGVTKPSQAPAAQNLSLLTPKTGRVHDTAQASAVVYKLEQQAEEARISRISSTGMDKLTAASLRARKQDSRIKSSRFSTVGSIRHSSIQDSGSLVLSVPAIKKPEGYRKSTFPIIKEDIKCPELYEDKWLHQQEIAVTQLINSLFENCGKETERTARSGDELRRGCLSIHQAPSNTLLYNRLQASLKFGALKIPNETLSRIGRLHDDLGQRRRFLDLWLKTYNPESLAAAAEAVIGREVKSQPQIGYPSPLRSNAGSPSKLKSLEIFLRKFLVRNEDCQPANAPKQSRGPLSPALKDDQNRPGSLQWQHRRTVLRSLMLILVLDKAQSQGELRGCLFQHSSPFKNSSEVLRALGIMLLPSAGDIMRVLGNLNYHVDHVQYPLQEYDYHLQNLAVDLRDGILLTRLIETLLYPPWTLSLVQQDVTITLPCGQLFTVFSQDARSGWILSQHLKYPCTSRCQKVHNVQVGLNALASVRDTGLLFGDITAEDIVDGHREKTLKLLWGLVGRWGLDVLLDANMLRREIRRLERTSVCVPVPLSSSGDLEDEMKGFSPCTHLLETWARLVASQSGIEVTNLSTSFADGRVYEAILARYEPALAVSNPCIHVGNTLTASSQRQHSIEAQLQRIGCSKAFVSLFSSSFTSTPPIPSKQTVIPLLVFLASRLLSIFEPMSAATTIQRVWRRKMQWKSFKNRLMLAKIAKEAATVVSIRDYILSGEPHEDVFDGEG